MLLHVSVGTLSQKEALESEGWLEAGREITALENILGKKILEIVGLTLQLR